MADALRKSTIGAPKAATAKVARVTLDEFCQRLSLKDRRVESISGFHHTERVARRVVDTEAAYASRFDAFMKQPA